MGKIATFQIADEIFGVDIFFIKEICKIKGVTEVPEAPDFILGLMNLRGQIVTVVRPSIILGKESRESSILIVLKNKLQIEPLVRKNFCADLKIANDSIAILVDELGDVVEYKNDDISPPPPHIKKRYKDFISGVVQFDNSLIVIINLEMLFVVVCSNIKDGEKVLMVQ